jgi:hypothetical protein
VSVYSPSDDIIWVMSAPLGAVPRYRPSTIVFHRAIGASVAKGSRLQTANIALSGLTGKQGRRADKIFFFGVAGPTATHDALVYHIQENNRSPNRAAAIRPRRGGYYTGRDEPTHGQLHKQQQDRRA